LDKKVKRVFVLLIKWLGVFLIGATLGMGGIYGYLSTQTGQPTAKRPFFVEGAKRPLVIAHRGGGGVFPENTLYAFQSAWKLGVDVLEMDIRETADGQLVIMHDKSVRRTTDGDGEVSEIKLEDLKKLNAGFNFTADGGQTFPFREQKVSIPTLAEVFTVLPDAKFNLEIKHQTPTMVGSLCRLIREHQMSEKVMVAAFSQTSLDEFRETCPEVATSGSTSEITKFFVYYKSGLGNSYTPLMSALQTPEKVGGWQIVSNEFVETARRLNLQVHVWTVNQPADMQRLIDNQVDGIMTDYPDKLLDLLGRSPKNRE